MKPGSVASSLSRVGINYTHIAFTVSPLTFRFAFVKFGDVDNCDGPVQAPSSGLDGSPVLRPLSVATPTPSPASILMLLGMFNSSAQNFAISVRPRTINGHPAIRPIPAGCTSKLSHPKGTREENRGRTIHGSGNSPSDPPRVAKALPRGGIGALDKRIKQPRTESQQLNL